MEKRRLYDGIVSLTSRKVTADRKAEYNKKQDNWSLTYEPHGNSGAGLDTNALVYELMIIAGCDMIEAGKVIYGGEYTASEMAGTIHLLYQFMAGCNPEWEDYKHIRIKTKTFECSFDADDIFKQIAEWEGVAGIANAKAYRFVCEGKEMPKGTVLKKYTRCHGYKPTTISMVMYERRINEKFEVLGWLYQSLTSEGMRKAMSVCAAARLFDNKSYEVKALVKTAMRWKLWKDYAKKEGASMMPLAFSETDFQCGPECYKQVDSKYVQVLVDHWNKMVADSPMPEWPKQGDVVQFKNREKMQKKYQGKYLCEGMTASLSTYGDRIEWRASLRVKKYDNEYFLPGQLEPWVDQKKTKAKTKAKKSSGLSRTKTDKPKDKKSSGLSRTKTDKPKAQTSAIRPQPSLADKLREVLMARLSA